MVNVYLIFLGNNKNIGACRTGKIFSVLLPKVTTIPFPEDFHKWTLKFLINFAINNRNNMSKSLRSKFTLVQSVNQIPSSIHQSNKSLFN